MAEPESTHPVVFSIFAGTGSVYDELVDAATAGQDAYWKEELLKRLDPPPRRVLDLACGTGILTFLLRERFPACSVVGVDLQEEYVAQARKRAVERGVSGVEFIVSSAEKAELPGLFDTAVTCYLPKYSNLSVVVPKVARALEPGGRLVFHDFRYPKVAAVQRIWEMRFEELREKAREKQPEALGMFEILPGVIRESRWVEELVDELGRNGFSAITVEELSFGTAAIVSARKGTGHP